MDKTLKKEKFKKYHESGAYICPFCGVANLKTLGEMSGCGTTVWNEVECKSCGKLFQEEYELKKVFYDEEEAKC